MLSPHHEPPWAYQNSHSRNAKFSLMIEFDGKSRGLPVFISLVIRGDAWEPRDLALNPEKAIIGQYRRNNGEEQTTAVPLTTVRLAHGPKMSGFIQLPNFFNGNPQSRVFFMPGRCRDVSSYIRFTGHFELLTRVRRSAFG